MTRIASLAPVALLAAACAAPVRTPADALGGDVEPLHREILLPSGSSALDAWQLPPDSPWARWEKLTLLACLEDAEVPAEVPDVDRIESVVLAEQAAARLAGLGLPDDTLWIVDLRGAASVAFGATLSRRSPQRIAPVLTFDNWPDENEVVPAEETLAALATRRPRRLESGLAPAIPVFLLDAWRLSGRDEAPDPSAFDNRYMLSTADFPSAEALRAAGIRRVVYVVEDRARATHEEDDIHEVALAWQAAGVPFAFVGLPTLAVLGSDDPSPVRWQAELDAWQLPIEPRVTSLHDPAFYERARGGFGGVRGSGGAGHGPRTHGGRVYTAASPHASGHGGG